MPGDILHGHRLAIEKPIDTNSRIMPLVETNYQSRFLYPIFVTGSLVGTSLQMKVLVINPRRFNHKFGSSPVFEKLDEPLSIVQELRIELTVIFLGTLEF
jgi:hypothetical protein